MPASVASDNGNAGHHTGAVATGDDGRHVRAGQGPLADASYGAGVVASPRDRTETAIYSGIKLRMETQRKSAKWQHQRLLAIRLKM